MIRLKRTPKPQALWEKEREWTLEFMCRLAANPQAAFKWPKARDKRPISHHIREALEAMSDNHCAYCEGFPLGVLSVQTIEHFKPKRTFPKQAFHWPNLFLACSRCQLAKKERFDPLLLKPDQASYQFSHYFWYEAFTGRLAVNTLASKEDQKRAELTIQLLDLNTPELCSDRKRWFRIFHQGGIEWKEAPYRFLFDRSKKKTTRKSRDYRED